MGVVAQWTAESGWDDVTAGKASRIAEKDHITGIGYYNMIYPTPIQIVGDDLTLHFVFTNGATASQKYVLGFVLNDGTTLQIYVSNSYARVYGLGGVPMTFQLSSAIPEHTAMQITLALDLSDLTNSVAVINGETVTNSTPFTLPGVISLTATTFRTSTLPIEELRVWGRKLSVAEMLAIELQVPSTEDSGIFIAGDNTQIRCYKTGAGSNTYDNTGNAVRSRRKSLRYNTVGYALGDDGSVYPLAEDNLTPIKPPSVTVMSVITGPAKIPLTPNAGELTFPEWVPQIDFNDPDRLTVAATVNTIFEASPFPKRFSLNPASYGDYLFINQDKAELHDAPLTGQELADKLVEYAIGFATAKFPSLPETALVIILEEDDETLIDWGVVPAGGGFEYSYQWTANQNTKYRVFKEGLEPLYMDVTHTEGGVIRNDSTKPDAEYSRINGLQGITGVDVTELTVGAQGDRVIFSDDTTKQRTHVWASMMRHISVQWAASRFAKEGHWRSISPIDYRSSAPHLIYNDAGRHINWTGGQYRRDDGVHWLHPDSPHHINQESELVFGYQVTGADAITAEDFLAGLIESGTSLKQALRLILASLAGKLTGAETGNIRIRDINDTTDRIVAQTDQYGNRTTVSTDAD